MVARNEIFHSCRRKGIKQTNGFFAQSVAWDAVNSYYLLHNTRFHKERRLHLEPVMFDAQENEVFRGFAHLLVSTRRIIEQRRQLWQFVESQLEGKKREAPRPRAVEPSILEIDWSQKNRNWKIGRVIALISYALLWSGIRGGLLIDTLNGGQHAWVTKFLLPLFFAPLIPHVVLLWPEKRKSARQSKEHGLSR